VLVSRRKAGEKPQIHRAKFKDGAGVELAPLAAGAPLAPRHG
jgi:hypothetical protein